MGSHYDSTLKKGINSGRIQCNDIRMEACPYINNKSNYMGPTAMAQVYLFNSHPTGAMEKEKRLDAITGDGGIADCGKVLNCERVCPKEISLVSIMGELNRQTAFRSFNRWLFK
ncbi:MAG TPA: hypothetical protein DCK87_05420 [Desulfotomaculum sp.]|nr:hypothetical protein [Desulfotomaculum sp.]